MAGRGRPPWPGLSLGTWDAGRRGEGLPSLSPAEPDPGPGRPRPRPRRLAAASLIIAVLAAPAPAAPAPTRTSCASSPLPPGTAIALVLSGGGAKGAWEAGVAAAFMARVAPVRLVAGSSAGALNATLVADGRVDRLRAAWRGITRDQVYALRNSIVFAGLLPGWLTLLSLDSVGSLFEAAPLRALIGEGIDLARVRASPVHVIVVATDLERREARSFDNQSLTVDALMASLAVPGAFPPVEIDGALLVDGGLTGRAPVLPALEAGIAVGRAVVVMSYAPDERGGRPTTMRRTLEEAFETSMIHQIRRDTELARLRYPAVDVQLLTPSAPLQLRPLDFDPEALAQALARGEADGAACLDALGIAPPPR